MPSLIVFTVAPETLLRVAFGETFVSAADALPILGLAMTLLAVSTLAVQYMLALHRTAFLYALAVAAIAEPLLLSGGDAEMRAFAEIVLAVQAAAAVACLGLALRARPAQAAVVTAPERWGPIADAPDPQPVRTSD